MKNVITTIYWNTWFDLQDGTRDNGRLVTKRLQGLIDEHSPDIFGLNEVYFESDRAQSPIIELLKKNGYSTHFATQTIGDRGQVIGNLFASKQKPLAITDRAFGESAKSHISWYKQYTPRLIEATMQFGDKQITFIVVHLCVMVPSDIITHIRHRVSYNRLIKTYDPKNLVIGGDFNELKYMPPWLHLPSHSRRLTGNLFNQTWLLNAKQATLLRGNMDNIIYSDAGPLRLVKFEVLERFPSDHTPLLAQFEIK